MPGTGFSVLFVCTGNICRSAMAERVLVARLGSPGQTAVTVRSAGTRAVVGRPISSKTIPLVRASGGDPEGFAATQLTEAVIAEADLILAMAEEHAVRVASLDPAAFSRTFLLLEFARAIEDLAVEGDPSDPGRWRDLTSRAIEARRRGLASPRGDDDVADPYGKSDEAFDDMARRLVPAIDILAARLAVA